MVPSGAASNLIEDLFDLPSLPTVAGSVLAATQGDTSVKEVSDLIEKDMTLSVKVLRVVNSSIHGLNREIDSVLEAVGLIGFKQISNLAVGISVVRGLPQRPVFGFSYSSFWERSISNAVAASRVASMLEGASDGLFTPALLQDIGTCILVRHAPLAYGQALGMATERQVHPIHPEREVLGADHAQVGAYLAKEWELPQSFQEIIRHHHYLEHADPGILEESIPGNEGLRFDIAIVGISNLITTVLVDPGGEEHRQRLLNCARSELKLNTAQIDELLEKLPTEIDEVRSLFQIDENDGTDAKEDPFHDHCPKCGSESVIRFCGECGSSLRKDFIETDESTHGYKILVAEDSEAIRTAIVGLLEKRGYTVLVAANGEEAVAMSGVEQPDMVLMDIRMPVMDGLEALRRIRADVRTSTTPVVMLTSAISLDTVTEAIDQGATDYVAKPFTIKKLLGTIERYTQR